MAARRALSGPARARAHWGTRRAAPEDPLDVLVVGGGVVGTGAALDAVSRGLSVGLLEQRDLASGTSSRSSKLVHGGLRYLEMLDFGLVREALEERGLLLTRLAPHLVRPVPFLYPLHRTVERPYVGRRARALRRAGHGRQATRWGCPSTSTCSAGRSRGSRPTCAPTSSPGAIRYYDCQVDDARLVVTLARTAAHHGALVATRTRVTGFLREGDRVVGVRATRPRERRADSRCARGSSSTPPGSGPTRSSGCSAADRTLDVEASKGIHLVVPRDRIRSECGFVTKTEKSVLFVIPWGRHWIIGTTDTAWDLDLAHPAASRTDIDYLLQHVNRMLKVPLDHDDVEGVYAGLRPLLAGKPGRGVGRPARPRRGRPRRRCRASTPWRAPCRAWC